jgi:thioredoxin-like negative regulator of GroEL
MLSRIANWIVWTALTAVVLVLIYKNTEWFKPAADRAMDSVRAVVSKVPAGPFSKESKDDKLTSAREAFASGNMDSAISLYNEAIKNHPKNADVRGELGNVFYATRRVPEAIQAYYDAAKLLLDNKEFDRVDALLPIIGQSNPMMADELMMKYHQAMDAAMMPPPANDGYSQQPQQSAMTRH